jgi:hypothetical protein
MSESFASEVRALRGHKDSITALCFRSLGESEGGVLLDRQDEICSGSDDGHARLWDMVRIYVCAYERVSSMQVRSVPRLGMKMHVRMHVHPGVYVRVIMFSPLCVTHIRKCVRTCLYTDAHTCKHRYTNIINTTHTY